MLNKVKKNVVVFMYNFPPIGAGRGIAWNKFCSNLAKEYDISLITIEPSVNDPIYNKSKLDDVSSNFNLFRTSPGFLYNSMYGSKYSDSSSRSHNSGHGNFVFKLLKKLYKTLIRSLIFPDRMIFWNKSAEQKFTKLRNEKNIDLIITVGFPFSTHLLGYKLKRKYGIKWIMDYGDPWSFNPSSETVPYYRRWLDRIVESFIIKSCDHITVTTETTKSAFESEFKHLPKITVIQQGVDFDLFRNRNDLYKFDDELTLNFFYSGIFYKDIRNPENFFIAISKIRKLPIKINIIIAGHMEDYIFEMLERLSFPECIKLKFVGNISFEEVVNYQIKSDGLLFFGNKGSLQVPGKIYEYLASGTPIFSISYQQDAVSEMIKFYRRGETSLNGVEELKNNFEIFIDKLLLGEGSYNKDDILDFDWKNISRKMNNVVSSVLEKDDV
ncbi:glycosyltransferase [Vibrio vulnificus]